MTNIWGRPWGTNSISCRTGKINEASDAPSSTPLVGARLILDQYLMNKYCLVLTLFGTYCSVRFEWCAIYLHVSGWCDELAQIRPSHQLSGCKSCMLIVKDRGPRKHRRLDVPELKRFSPRSVSSCEQISESLWLCFDWR